MWKHFQEGTIGDKGGGRAFLETELALLVRPPAGEAVPCACWTVIDGISG